MNKALQTIYPYIASESILSHFFFTQQITPKHNLKPLESILKALNSLYKQTSIIYLMFLDNL